MRNRDRQTRSAHKDAALKININARLDAPQFIENNQNYARMTRRAPEKHHISNADAATKRHATQRKQQSHALPAEETQKAQAAPPTQRRRAEAEQKQQRATRRIIRMKNFRNNCAMGAPRAWKTSLFTRECRHEARCDPTNTTSTRAGA